MTLFMPRHWHGDISSLVIIHLADVHGLWWDSGHWLLSLPELTSWSKTLGSHFHWSLGSIQPLRDISSWEIWAALKPTIDMLNTNKLPIPIGKLWFWCFMPTYSGKGSVFPLQLSCPTLLWGSGFPEQQGTGPFWELFWDVSLLLPLCHLPLKSRQSFHTLRVEGKTIILILKDFYIRHINIWWKYSFIPFIKIRFFIVMK